MSVQVDIRREIRRSPSTLTKSYDAVGGGGMHHRYKVKGVRGNVLSEFAEINFQNGPISEVGVNGCQNEDLIAVVMDRLECAQKGEFPCDENANALKHLASALAELNLRTARREAQGVEGFNIAHDSSKDEKHAEI